MTRIPRTPFRSVVFVESVVRPSGRELGKWPVAGLAALPGQRVVVRALLLGLGRGDDGAAQRALRHPFRRRLRLLRLDEQVLQLVAELLRRGGGARLLGALLARRRGLG